MPAALPLLDELTGLDHAVGVWRKRRDGAHDTVEVITSAVDDLAWSGAAADAFDHWVHQHIDRWHTLAETADTIGAALADPRTDAEDDHGPNLPALTEHPPPLPVPLAPTAQPAGAPSFTPETVTTPSSSTTLSPAGSPPSALPAPETSETGTAASPDQRDGYSGDISGALNGPHRHNATTTHQPLSGVSDEQRPDSEATNSDPSDGEAPDSETSPSEASTPNDPDGEPTSVSIPQQRAASDTSPGAGAPGTGSDAPAASMSMAPRPVVPPDAAAFSGGNLAAATPPPASSDTGASVSPMAPSAAVAGAAALARADRAHCVVREITIPEPRSSTPAPPGPINDRQDATTGPRMFRPVAPTPGWPIPPARSDLGPVPSAVGSGPAPGPMLDTEPAARPAGSRPGRALDTRAADGHLPMWVNLNPASEQGAWIDIAARPGLGLHGPGAAAIARTALCELHHHTATHMLLPRTAFVGLLTGPEQTRPAVLDDVAVTDRIHLVDDPHQALHALHARLNAPPVPDNAGSSIRPYLLVVPAPTTAHSHAALAATTEQLRSHPAGVLVIGTWPHGATLDIDPNHRVQAHHHPAGTDLTGARLHPTRPDDLAHSLHSGRREVSNDPVESTSGVSTVLDDVGHDPGGPPDTAAPTDHEAGSGPCRTPLALSVLGPIELRYRRSTLDTDQPDDHRSGPVTETWITITGLPQPSRDLLAFLAANPAGVTRETIIEALWPHSTSAKPENSFYQAKSRLAAIVADTTGDSALKELLVNPDRRWLLNSRVVTVDYWTLLEASTPHTTDTERRTAYRAAAHAYGGLFAADVTGGWAHDIRESARRRFLEIIADLAEIEARDNARVALDLLERARNLEPLNEGIYRSIMQLQINGGRTDEARRTFELLRSQLAYIDVEPDSRSQRLITAHAS